jgi:DNA-binding PadR family transcriptional regulator
MMWRMARGFPFGPGMRRGGPRMFGRGDLKYALLQLLQQRPMHGYEMIRELEERSSGFYTPSAGAVYPTLQLLEDRGWVTSQTTEGKKVYTITDAGRQAANEHEERADEWGGPGRGFGFGFGGHEHMHEHASRWREARPELHALRRDSMEVARLMRAAVMVSGGDPERLARLRAIVERTRDDLNAYLGQAPSGEGRSPSGEGPAPETPPEAAPPPTQL